MKQLHFTLLAFAAGLAGGIAGARLGQVHGSGPEVIRARSFELVDGKGNVLSYWGIGQNEYVMLAFGNHWPADMLREHPESHPPLKETVNQMLALGVQGNSPFVTLRGSDKATRMRLYTLWDKPILAMDDENGIRLSLGVQLSDTPGPQDNDWGLGFSPNSATIGMHAFKKDGKQYIRGYQWLYGGQFLQAQPVEYPPGQDKPAK